MRRRIPASASSGKRVTARPAGAQARIAGVARRRSRPVNVTRIRNTCCVVADMERALSFLRHVVGLTLRFRDGDRDRNRPAGA
jgi:hypothetical protein